MRSFILIVLIFAFSGLSAVQAQEETNGASELFTIVESFDPEVDDAGNVVETPNLNAKIHQGMRDLLVRLTGDGGILQTDDGRDFVNQAKAWLSSYHFAPRKEEGVVVGQNLVLEFDRQRLLEVFQRNSILIWPSSERPTTLVMGSFIEAGSVLKLNPEALSYRPDIEFRSYPKLLALPLQFPTYTSDWLQPQAGQLSAEQIQQSLGQFDSQYLLMFELSGQPERDYSLTWRVYGQNGEEYLSGSNHGNRVQPLMNSMFDRMMASYSYGYRQSASMMGVAVLGMDQLASAEQLIDVENFLKSQKPAIHQVSLQAVKGSRAEFEVVYQGRYDDVLQIFKRIENSKLVDESALTGKVEMKMLGLAQRPETQLIDLSKEFEENMREGQ
ncbi:DUF2066 domain-containing protein [Thiomicrorhabdus sp. ZW0627]|uniref:DUF2066 domain-containing protein n=1 Tax=Thiomicrorhabdus sp. ZW0627 TaxID=3039774 RepID=UPI002436B08D|nr:DUF2066 domain-containing protein [Thiomicrorhabdus sp. ZW0627]MDG6773279.1 DUF2066 domain-containing protein [Thiomicrorhabdus sp. ZW0627]